jgi:hypothetical protein
MTQSVQRSIFKPSWLNRLLDRMYQLRLPRWLSSLLIPIGLFILAHIILYLLEPSLAWTVQGEITNLLFWLGFILSGYNYLLSAGWESLNDFRPCLRMDEKEFVNLRKRFLLLPRRWGWLAIPPFALAILFTNFRPPIPAKPEVALIIQVIMILLAAITFTGAIHVMVTVIRMLKTINQLYERIVKINIFNLEDLYALSALTAKVGIFFVVAGTMSYIINIVVPEGQPQTEVAIFFVSSNSLMAVLAFLLPLLGIHRKLVKEKKLVAQDNNRRLKVAMQILHERSDRSQLEEMPLIKAQIGALLEFRREIGSISTWPWRPQTLRGFITAISLPIVVWLIQQFLAGVIGA